MATFDTSTEGIRRLLAQGESEHVEFKSKLSSEGQAAEILAAFANSQGGILLVGVGSSDQPIGLTEQEATRTTSILQRTANSLLSSELETGSVLIDSSRIVYAVVDLPADFPRPVATATGGIYIRRGASTTPMTLSELRDQIISGESPVSPSTKSHYAVFVAMSFRTEEEPALVDYYRAIERAVERTQLPIKLARIDLVEGDYEISQRIMDEIDAADIVVTDFTLSPANVYFELGYARGRQKRIIQTARKGTSLEFDIRNWRTTFYRNATELEERMLSELMVACAGMTG